MRPETRTTPICRRVDSHVRGIKAMCHDARARREWLWLRAREKDDELAIELLERADAELRSRMAPIDARLVAVVDTRERRAAYGRMLDERLPDVEEVPCGCPDCAAAALR